MDSEDEEEMAAAQAAAPPPPPPVVPGEPVEGGGDGGGEGAIVAAEGGEEEGGGGGGIVQAAWLVKQYASDDPAQAIFCADGNRLNLNQLTDLTKAAPEGKVWELPDGGKLISSDAGTVHPRQFAVQKLTQLASFQIFHADAVKHTTGARVRGESHGKALEPPPGSTEISEDLFALRVINDVIYLKLKTIYAAVLDTAAVGGHWLLLDRIAAKSPSAELLIEAALDQTSARPTILAIDDLSRLQNFKGPNGDGPLGENTQKCLNSLTKAREGGVPFPAAKKDVPVGTIGQFYDVSRFEFGEGEDGEFNTLDLPRPAEPAHIGADGLVPARVKWQYHYLETFFGHASHYIILDNADDRPELNALKPGGGFIYSNGQAMMLDRLKQNIAMGLPIVMLHNTGGAVQAFSALRAEILAGNMEDDKLLDVLDKNLVSPQTWAQRFGLPEILMMKGLHQRAPMLFRKTIVEVNVMLDTSEDVVNTVTACFSDADGLPELGIGDQEEVCILTAWKRHCTLYENAQKYVFYANALQLSIYALGVLTTMLVVVAGILGVTISAEVQAGALGAISGIDGISQLAGAVGLDLPGDSASGSGEVASGDAGSGAAAGGAAAVPAGSGGPGTLFGFTPIELVLVLLPIIIGCLMTINTKIRPREKWATCLMASYQIVSLIYKFRMKATPYDPEAPLPPDPATGEIPVISPTKRKVNCRQDFIAMCTAVYSYAIATELTKGGALRMGKYATTKTQTEEERREFKKFLKVWNERIVLHMQPKFRETPDLVPKKKGGKKKGGGLFGLRGKVAPGLTDAIGEALDDAEDAFNATANAVTGKLASEGFNDLDGNEEEEGKLEVGDDLGAKQGSKKVDDLTSPITIETYMECRALPLSEYFQDRAPKIVKWSFRIEFASMLATTAGALLAVLSSDTYPLKDWMPVTVAIQAVLMNIMDFFYIQPQLAATNRAFEEIHNLQLRYDGFSLIQRKNTKRRDETVNLVEDNVLATISAMTAVSPMLPSLGGEEEEEG